jgi:hypothetical protein
MMVNGLVGFFDVLGYQNIIDNNEIAVISKILGEILLKVPDHARNYVRESTARTHATKQIVDRIMKNAVARLISDSILIVQPFRSEAPSTRYLEAILGIAFARHIFESTFTHGLPVRGAIDIGEVYLDDHCFAGKPAIECFRLGQALNLAACVVTPRAATILDDMARAAPELETSLADLFVRFLCPMKDGSYAHHNALRLSARFLQAGDPRQMVFDSFCMHNKDIGPGVLEKLGHTECLIRQMRSN